jgi:hypothetical protein
MEMLEQRVDQHNGFFGHQFPLNLQLIDMVTETINDQRLFNQRRIELQAAVAALAAALAETNTAAAALTVGAMAADARLAAAEARATAAEDQAAAAADRAAAAERTATLAAGEAIAAAGRVRRMLEGKDELLYNTILLFIPSPLLILVQGKMSYGIIQFCN